MTIADKLRKEGMQQGMQQALQEDILEILEIRFQSVSYSIKKQLEAISDAPALRRLLRLAVQAQSLEQFTNGMPACPHASFAGQGTRRTPHLDCGDSSPLSTP